MKNKVCIFLQVEEIRRSFCCKKLFQNNKDSISMTLQRLYYNCWFALLIPVGTAGPHYCRCLAIHWVLSPFKLPWSYWRPLCHQVPCHPAKLHWVYRPAYADGKVLPSSQQSPGRVIGERCGVFISVPFFQVCQVSHFLSDLRLNIWWLSWWRHCVHFH